MRKIKVAIVTIMIVMVMGISSLFGCSLVTTNNARDLSQVVATVQINENAPKDVIYKRDLITAYMNNYQYQGAELTQDTLDGILSSLINNRVLIQFALDEMDNNYAKPSDWNDLSKYNEYLENFLSDLEELDARSEEFLLLRLPLRHLFLKFRAFPHSQPQFLHFLLLCQVPTVRH